MNHKKNYNQNYSKSWRPENQYSNYYSKDKNSYNGLQERDNFFNLTALSKNKSNSRNISKQIELKNSEELNNLALIKDRVNQVKRKNDSKVEQLNKELKTCYEDIKYYENKKRKLNEEIKKITDELRSVESTLFSKKNKYSSLEKQIERELQNEKKSINNEKSPDKFVNNFKETPLNSENCQHENAQKTINNIISNLLIDKKENKIKFEQFDFIFNVIEEIFEPKIFQYNKSNLLEINFTLKKLISSEEKKKGFRIILRAAILDEKESYQKDNLSFVKSFEFLVNNKKSTYENNDSAISKLIFPFDITDYVKLDKKIKIFINLNSKIAVKDTDICFGIFFVKKLEYKQFIPVFEANNIIKKKEIGITKTQIKNAFSSIGDVKADSMKISLIDPLSKAKITMPCTGRLCKHLSVFDGLTFLESNAKKFSWFCPICGEPIKYGDLFIDLLVCDIIKKISVDCIGIEFDPSLNWMPMSNSTSTKKIEKEDDDCITLE